MVNKEKIDNKPYFQCEICGFYYDKKKWAEKCEKWCKEHHSCNIEITKHAIQLNNKGCC